jgi:hypothetical protein
MDRARPRSMVDRPWTAAPGSPELWPPAAPVSTGASQGAGEEWNTGRSVGGSPWRRRQCGGRASRQHGGGRGGGRGVGRWGDVPVRERRREELGEGQDAPRVLGGFYRGRGGGTGEGVTPRFEETELKPPYVCPKCSNHTYGRQYGEQIQYLIKLQTRIFTK